MSKYIPKKDKKEVAKRAKKCCKYCLSQMDYSSTNFSIEHIIPHIKGGTNNLDNLAFACQRCNNLKYTKTEGIDEVSGKKVKLYNPRLDKWSTHFKWSKDFIYLIGQTAKGRITISMLKLNRKGVIMLRKVLRDIKKHPPF